MPFCLMELVTAKGLGKAVGARCEWTWPKAQRGLGCCMVALVNLQTVCRPCAACLEKKPGQPRVPLGSLTPSEESLSKALWKTIPNASWGEGSAVWGKGSQAAGSPAPFARHGAAWTALAGRATARRSRSKRCRARAMVPCPLPVSSSCCHRCSVTTVSMSAPLLPPPQLPQQLWSETDWWLSVGLGNHGALGPL